MTFSSSFTRKQKRTIQRDINLLFSRKALESPQNMQDFKKIGFLSTRVKINGEEVFLSKPGKTALNRICDFIHLSKKYNGLLNYNNIFNIVLDDIGKWMSNNFIPDDDEFIISLDEELSNEIDEYNYICRVEGIKLDNIESIKIGNRVVKKYDSSILKEVTDIETSEDMLKKEFTNKLVIIGSEFGSSEVSLEKFYHNAELSLSVLRLFAYANYTQAVNVTNIRLVNNCTNAYESTISFGWPLSTKSLCYTRHYGAAQDLKVNNEARLYFKNSCFFDEISSYIDKKNRTELENAIVKSLYWVGEAQKDQSKPSSWVKLWSCLECFFSLTKDEITESNARGISSIIFFGGYKHDQYEDYDELKQKIKSYYDLRSKIVHRASYTDIGDSILIELSYIVSWVIIVMASLAGKGYVNLKQVQERTIKLDTVQNRWGQTRLILMREKGVKYYIHA